tara:strand:+ start:927 stop:1346 length:420 start_codon:yes stop_codon:yes gene_type:complete
MKSPIYSYKIYKTETNEVINFCLNKFDLKDVYKLNDKFEGRKFYQNTLKKYLINKFLFKEILKNNIKNKFFFMKYNYINLLMSNNISSISIINIADLKKSLDNYQLVFLSNPDSLKLDVYSNDPLILQKIKKIDFEIKV